MPAEGLLSPPIRTPQYGVTAYVPCVEHGSNVLYVGTRRSQDPPSLSQGGQLYPTIKSALGDCRSGTNDVIAVLPGHTEPVDSAWSTNLKAGTRIVGLALRPDQSTAPKFTFAAAASTIDIDVANVTIENMRFQTVDDEVTIGIDVNADGFGFVNNYVRLATDADDEFTLFMDIGAADNVKVIGNTMVGKTGPSVAIDVTGAAERLEIAYNDIQTVTSGATAGVLDISAAALQLNIHHNFFSNETASSSRAITMAAVACTGRIARNECGIKLATAVAAAAAITPGAGNLTTFVENYGGGTGAASALLTPAAVT